MKYVLNMEEVISRCFNEIGNKFNIPNGDYTISLHARKGFWNRDASFTIEIVTKDEESK